MNASRAVAGAASAVVAGSAAVAGAIAGMPAALDAGAGAAGGSLLQALATGLLLRAHGQSTDRFLLGFGRAAGLRVFGSVLLAFVALATDWVAPAPFLAGYGAAYVVLEVVADVLFIRNEKQLSLGS